jgi:hypothetical protein
MSRVMRDLGNAEIFRGQGDSPRIDKITAVTELFVRASSLTIVQYSFESWTDGSVL